MKNLFVSMFLACPLAAQAIPGFSTATIVLSGFPTTTVVLGGAVETKSDPFPSPIDQSFDMALPTGEFCTLEINARPAPFPQVGTFLVNYKCSYGVSVGKTITVVPPGNVSFKFVEPGTSASTGTFSVTGAATGSPNFATLRMLEVSKAVNKVGADQLTGQPTPWEFYNAQVSNTVNQLGFVRDNTQGPTGTGVTVRSEDFVPGAMIDVLVLSPSINAFSIPGISGLVRVDPTSQPLMFLSNATGGCSMKAPEGYETSALISGYRSQMFRVNQLGCGALSHIDW